MELCISIVLLFEKNDMGRHSKKIIFKNLSLSTIISSEKYTKNNGRGALILL